MKKVIDKIPAFVFSNYFIAIIITFILFFSIGFKFSRYKAEVKKEVTKLSSYENSYFTDINGDDVCDKLFIFNNNNTGYASVVFFKNTDIADFQYNLQSRLIKEEFYYQKIDDIDGDSIKEIIFCTHKADSLFLNILFIKDSIIHNQYFLDLIKKSEYGDYSYQFYFSVTDLDNDDYKEIILSVFGYFSTSPRKLFLYNHKDSSIISSNTNGNIFRKDLLVSDINQDGIKEITGFTKAPSNIKDQTSVKYSDASSWLLVFDNKLNLLFEPIEEKTEYSIMYLGIIGSGKEKTIFYWLANDQNKERTVFFVNPKGEKKDSLIIPKKTMSKISGIISVEDQFGYLYNEYGDICLINKELEIEKVINLKKERKQNAQYIYNPMNINKDSSIEFLIYNTNGEAFIAEEGFKHITPIGIPNLAGVGLDFQYVQLDDNLANILIQNNDKVYFVDYSKNELYSLRFLSIPLIYILTYIVLQALTYLQRIQIKKKTERERELLELQLKTIKNQIEPHFLYNTMTSIGHLIISEDRYEAYNYLESLASLTRKSLEMSDSVAVSLKGELEFIENYIELQKLRFEEKFIFEIQIDPNVDLNTKLPKMLLQIHVENAIKHGLMHKKAGGILKIHISKDDNNLLCVIEDNGIGLQESKKYLGNNTGKGLEIAQQTIDLYKKIHKIEIKQEIIDLTGINSSKKGVKVAINILL